MNNHITEYKLPKKDYTGEWVLTPLSTFSRYVWN